MRALADLSPLRDNRTFRRLWLGTTASGFGGQFGSFAVIYYVWDRTHSAAVVGLVGLAVGVPLIALALAGSAFADHVDRRQLALRCTVAQIVVSAHIIEQLDHNRLLRPRARYTGPGPRVWIPVAERWLLLLMPTMR